MVDLRLGRPGAGNVALRQRPALEGRPEITKAYREKKRYIGQVKVIPDDPFFH